MKMAPSSESMIGSVLSFVVRPLFLSYPSLFDLLRRRRRRTVLFSGELTSNDAVMGIGSRVDKMRVGFVQKAFKG